MAKSKTTGVHVAAVTLTGGKPLEAFTVAAGEPLTAEAMKGLGIGSDDLPGMIARGQVLVIEDEAAPPLAPTPEGGEGEAGA